MNPLDDEPTEAPMVTEETAPALDAAQAQSLGHEMVALTRVLFGLPLPVGAYQLPASGYDAPQEYGAVGAAELTEAPGLGPETSEEPQPQLGHLRSVPTHPVSAPSPLAVPTPLPLPEEVPAAGPGPSGPGPSAPAQVPVSAVPPVTPPVTAPTSLPLPGGVPVPDVPAAEQADLTAQNGPTPDEAAGPAAQAGPTREPTSDETADKPATPSIPVPGQPDRPRRDRRSLDLLQEIAFLDE